MPSLDADRYLVRSFARWVAKVQFGASLDECWLWRGAVSGGKYGAFSLRIEGEKRSGLVPAHRAGYEFAFGPVPSGSHVHHRCHVTLCVNPWHMLVATPAEHGAEHPDIAHFIERKPRESCMQGHPFTPESTRVHADGKRQCLICFQAAAERTKLALRSRHTFNRGDHKTHCKYGHAWIPEIIYTKPSTGHRECIACIRARTARLKAR